MVEVNGIELHYETAGQGEPLLWLHGFMGAGADWKYVFERPPDGYQLIAPDLRGHGASTNPPGTFSFRQAALDVVALLRHLRIDAVKAIGLSGGGITLLHMATMRPASIESMVIVSAPPYFPEQARSLQRQASESMFEPAEMALMRQRHRHGDLQIQQLLAQGRAFAASYDDVNFTPPLLGTIAADTLIVFGDRDPFYPVSLAFDLQLAIPRSYLWVIPNGGHGPIFGEHAAPFARTASSFLDGAWRAGRAA
jgi:pimeloyl-ACP methyl ester carboxylesterase